MGEVHQSAWSGHEMIARLGNQPFFNRWSLNGEGILTDPHPFPQKKAGSTLDKFLYATHQQIFLYDRRGSIEVFIRDQRGEIIHFQSLFIQLIFLQSLQELLVHNDHLLAVCSDGCIEVWKLDPLGKYAKRQTLSEKNQINQIAARDDFLSVGLQDGATSFWQMDMTGYYTHLKTFLRTNGNVRSVAIDKGVFIAGYSDGQIRVRNFHSE